MSPTFELPNISAINFSSKTVYTFSEDRLAARQEKIAEAFK
jgi:hypothetical protein